MANKLLFACAILFVLVIPLIIGSAGASSTMWSKTYGTRGGEIAYAVIETSDGGYAIAGGTVFIDTESKDFWLVKTDAEGNMQWNKTYCEKGDQWAYSVIETSDGGYAIAGYTKSFDVQIMDFWLVKTDSTGTPEWNRTYGGAASGVARSLIQTSDGGYALVGDAFFVKTDIQGNIQWNKAYPAYLECVVATFDGGYALAGENLFVKTDAQGNMQWNKTYPKGHLDSLVATTDGGYALAGFMGSYVEGYDFWLIKTDVMGNTEWNQTYGGTGHEQAYSLVETLDAGFCLVGGNLLVKTDKFGNMQWNQTYGHGTAYSLIKTSDGGYALAGEILSSATTSDDFWIVKTNEYGIPEFPSWLIFPLIIAASFATIIFKHKTFKQSKALTLLFGFFLFTSCLSACVNVKADVKRIVVPDDYESIQDAIEAAPDGCVIFVKKGVYEEEKWNIKKSISIIGEGKECTLVSFDPPLVPLSVFTQTFLVRDASITVNANDFSLSGFTIDSADGPYEGSVKGAIYVTGNRSRIVNNDIATSLFLVGSSLELTDNNISGNVRVTGSHEKITLNTIKKGLEVKGFYCNITGNSVTLGGDLGIYVDGSSNEVCCNNISGHEKLEIHGDTNLVINNSVNSYGIEIVGSENVVRSNAIKVLTVSDNNNTFIANNVSYSLWIFNNNETTSHTFYHNNFIGEPHLSINFSNLQHRNVLFDNGIEGNYWSDYNGTDNNGDGIGDSPYVINENFQDNYPLMSPISTFQVLPADASTEAWETKSDLNEPRGRLGVAVVNGKIYAIGGDSGSYFGGSPNNHEYMGLKKFVSTNEEYDPSFDNWTSKASMPTPRYHFATAVYDNKIYCIGGLTIENDTRIIETGINEVYDPETDTWEQKTSMPTPRMRLDASVVNGKIYLIGGHTVSNYIVTNSCDVYDPISDSWTTKELSPPYGFVPEASVVIDNKIYFLGKKSTQLPPYIEAFIQIYDPETDVWITGNPAPLYISTATVCATTGIYAPKRMHVFDPDGHYVYDPASDTWTNATQMLTIRGYTGVGVINDTIYIVGGILLPPENILIGEISSTPTNEKYIPTGYIPEFPSMLIFPLVIAASFAAIICKHKLSLFSHKNSTKTN